MADMERIDKILDRLIEETLSPLFKKEKTVEDRMKSFQPGLKNHLKGNKYLEGDKYED